jgi:alpha-L-fucosidase
VYGEGPTQVVEGSFNDTKREPFTGQDVRFTTKEGVLYAILLAWPGESVTIQSLATSSDHAEGEVDAVTLLGYDGRLEWDRNAEGLTVKLPASPPCEHAYALKITGLS